MNCCGFQMRDNYFIATLMMVVKECLLTILVMQFVLILFNKSCDGVALDGKLQFDNGGAGVYTDGNTIFGEKE